MEMLASWIWNPMLSLIYLEVGILFLVLTKGVALRRAIDVLKQAWHSRSRKKSSDNHRHIQHTDAFIAALAAGIGVGNLAGVGTAIHLGGPGALFWMWMSALMGASFRMCSVYVSVRYGPTDHNSPLFATPMAYIEKFVGRFWPGFAPMLAGLILFQGLVSANLIQANSVAHAVTNELGVSTVVVALTLFVAVAVVVVGGVKSIVNFSVASAPFMVVAYVVGGVIILFANPQESLRAVGLVFTHAFTPYSIGGGVAGYTLMQTIQFGVSRGVFSHFSGMGIAPFLHGANDDHPSQGAYLAALVPLIDTLVVCSITGFVILAIGDWHGLTGAYLTVTSFQAGLGGLGRVLVFVCLGMFAFTTIINWAYFSERCFEYLWGGNVKIYRWFFAGMTFCGPFFPVALVWSMADVVIGIMLLVHLPMLTYILLLKLPTIMQGLLSWKGE
ncbi:MAG: sodium:alanine symporter family protein [Magnetococcales bacterium]|nr:sodium:alanine symporter family protein [Magnetococcales bacterium]